MSESSAVESESDPVPSLTDNWHNGPNRGIGHISAISVSSCDTWPTPTADNCQVMLADRSLHHCNGDQKLLKMNERSYFEVVHHTRAQPECDMFNRGSSYFHVPRTTVCHMFCRMTNKICLQDGGVGDLSIRCRHGSFAHKMATFLRVLPTRRRQQTKRKQKQCRIYLTFAFSERHVMSPPGDREAVNIW